MRLERVLRALVLSVSATHCDDGVAAEDASTPLDASAREPSDATFTFVPDSGFTWCEAGAPTFVAACGSCCRTVAVPCPIPPGDYVDDAGGLYFCDRYCGSGPWQGCYVADASQSITYVTCGCTGRRFEGYAEQRSVIGAGGLFANMARLEGASVFAFERMHDELHALGASQRLLKRVKRATADERRHTRMMTRLAKRFGGRVVPVRSPRFRARGIEAIAIENATEGCVRELFGALVATSHAMRVRDGRMRRTFSAIARDESRHAELALRVATFLSLRLDASARTRVASARRDAITRLRHDLACDARSVALFEALFR